MSIFSDDYLISSNINDIARLLDVGPKHGFIGMLGNINDMQ